MKSKQPKISIVTPSFNMLPYLRLCHASIIDQGMEIEHIVMDGGSTDGTIEAFKKREGMVFISEKDTGMYNALNKAINKSTGEIIGHLNCDEQYLPETLPYIQDFFDRNPDIDFIAGDFLVINPDGGFVAFRKSFQPRWPYFFSNYLYTTTCTLFYRRRIFDVCSFDESYKSIADVIFLYNVLKKGFKGIHLKKYFSAFTYSGTNLSLNPISSFEKKRFNKTLPLWYRLIKPAFFILFFVERVLHNNYKEAHILHYSIYTNKSSAERITLTKLHPGFRLKFKSFVKSEGTDN